MRAAIAAIIGAFLAGGVQQVSGESIANPHAHVRAMQKEGVALLAEGMAHSPSFRRLVDRIEQSHVIVYIDVRPDMRPGVGGSLRFLAESATDRFLRIQLNRSVARLWQVALLGHELQHAVEVAEAPGIHSAEDLRMLYWHIGVSHRRRQLRFDCRAPGRLHDPRRDGQGEGRRPLRQVHARRANARGRIDRRGRAGQDVLEASRDSSRRGGDGQRDAAGARLAANGAAFGNV